MRDYIPADLRPDLIDAIFKSAVATKTSKSVIKCILFKKENGFPQDSRPIFFDEEEIKIITPKLEYLLGQVKAVHQNQKSITPQSAIKKYDDTTWLNNQNTLLSFLHLLCAANIVEPINAKTSNLDFIEEIYPTISVSDPNFLSWQEIHKPKILRLIKERNGGQEPADD